MDEEVIELLLYFIGVSLDNLDLFISEVYLIIVLLNYLINKGLLFATDIDQ
jgi:hypothetical protein